MVYRHRDRLLLRSLPESTHREPEAPYGRSIGDGRSGIRTGRHRLPRLGSLAVPLTSLLRDHTLTTLIGTSVQLRGPRHPPHIYLVTPTIPLAGLESLGSWGVVGTNDMN